MKEIKWKYFLCSYSDPPQTGYHMQLANSTISIKSQRANQGRDPTSDSPLSWGSNKMLAPDWLHLWAQTYRSDGIPTTSTSALLICIPLLAFLSTWCLMQGLTRESWVNPSLSNSVPAVLCVNYRLCCLSLSIRRRNFRVFCIPTALWQTESQTKKEGGKKRMYGFCSRTKVFAEGAEWAGFEEKKKCSYSQTFLFYKQVCSLLWDAFCTLDTQSSFCSSSGFQIHFLRHQNKCFSWL